MQQVLPEQIKPGTATPQTLATVNGAATWITGSVPVILLPAGSTAANVPAGTPVGTIILVKA